VVHPDAVDQHAGRERVVFARDRLGEFESAAALGEGLAVLAGEDLDELALAIGPRLFASPRMKMGESFGLSESATTIARGGLPGCVRSAR
jgi:hypothetical protein